MHQRTTVCVRKNPDEVERIQRAVQTHITTRSMFLFSQVDGKPTSRTSRKKNSAKPFSPFFGGKPQAFNFKGEQIRLAMGKTGGYDARAALEWLLVNIPKQARVSRFLLLFFWAPFFLPGWLLVLARRFFFAPPCDLCVCVCVSTSFFQVSA